MKLVVQNLAERLIGLIRDRIISGLIVPGEQIRQDALAAEFGVSKIPLREALARLEEEGLLVSQAQRGFQVRALSVAEVEEVFALRLKLEPDVIALAAVRASAADHRAARETLESLSSATNEHGSGVGAFNRAFHLALIRPSGQPIVTQILERLHVLSERYVRKHMEPLGRDDRANQEHQQMFDAWISRDQQSVKHLTKLHTKQSLADLRDQLSKETGAVADKASFDVV